MKYGLRIPAWAKGSTLEVNGQNVENILTGSFAQLERQWSSGDKITLNMPMQAKFIEGHPRIEELRNQVAVKRGPVVYALESPDLPKGTHITDVYISSSKDLKSVHKPNELGGVTTIETELLIRKDEQKGMYNEVSKPKLETYSTQLIPYYTWSNRGQGEMTVFMPIIWD